jgi:ABC-type bacteriocin/lantibiotic exporter with double-glycine peptidase domain
MLNVDLPLKRIIALLLILGGFTLSTRAQSSPIWLDVPFIKQGKDGCGAASIAMVMQYWLRQQGRPADHRSDAAHIQRALYSSQAHGIFASQMEHYFQQNGFRAFTIRGEWEDLQQHLRKGRPLIVALKSGASDLHYVVVAGLDSAQNLVLVNDPAQRKLLKQDRASFEREWSATEKWTLLALPQSDAH